MHRRRLVGSFPDRYVVAFATALTVVAVVVFAIACSTLPASGGAVADADARNVTSGGPVPDHRGDPTGARPVTTLTPHEPPGSRSNASLVAVYPNPVARGDPGEFVAVRFPDSTDTTGWLLGDGRVDVRLPNRTLTGTVALSVTPTDAREHTDHPVFELEGRLQLADAGETLELRRANGEQIDSAVYHHAPESEIRDLEAGGWRSVGATDRQPKRRTGGAEATAFVLPDAADLTVETLRGAEERLLLGGYTLTSERVTDALLDTDDRGVEVRVLLDGAPVGGASERQARLLDRLAEAGVEVRLLAGPHG